MSSSLKKSLSPYIKAVKALLPDYKKPETRSELIEVRESIFDRIFYSRKRCDDFLLTCAIGEVLPL